MASDLFKKPGRASRPVKLLARPRVSVLMTTHNGADLVSASIYSVLNQTFEDFELIVVDDASTDDTVQVLAAIADSRLRVIRQEINGGIVAARNLGFSVARGQFVAALDQDDLSLPERLTCQVAYLDYNPSVVLVGTGTEILKAGRRKPQHQLPYGDPALMRWLLHVDNPVTWSSVMFRAEAVEQLGGFMRPQFELADDFDFYHRLLSVGDIACLTQPLTIYRAHERNTSLEYAKLLRSRAIAVLCEAYAPILGLGAELAADLVVRHLSERAAISDISRLTQLGRVIEQLTTAFSAHLSGIDQARLATAAAQVWWRSVRAAARAGMPEAICFYNSIASLAADFRPSRADVIVSLAIGGMRAFKRWVPKSQWQG